MHLGSLVRGIFGVDIGDDHIGRLGFGYNLGGRWKMLGLGFGIATNRICYI